MGFHTCFLLPLPSPPKKKYLRLHLYFGWKHRPSYEFTSLWFLRQRSVNYQYLQNLKNFHIHVPHVLEKASPENYQQTWSYIVHNKVLWTKFCCLSIYLPHCLPIISKKQNKQKHERFSLITFQDMTSKVNLMHSHFLYFCQVVDWLQTKQ